MADEAVMAIFLQHHNGLSCPQGECEAQAQARGLYCRGQVRVGEPIGLMRIGTCAKLRR
jgi:hypothetical protein